MDALEPLLYEKVRPLFREMDYHLAVNAILEGTVSATIYVDDPACPQAALTWTTQRFFLAGEGNAEFDEDFRQLLVGKLFPQAREAGKSVFVLYYTHQWEDTIKEVLKDRHPIKAQGQVYTLKTPHLDWRALLPKGFTLQPVDAALLDMPLKNMKALREEMCSERASVEEFLAKSFGSCLIHDDELVGWCLSEYNTKDSCVIGIETCEPYRGRGLATLMASAFVEHALSRGIAHIGWHCYASNTPSVATALKVGFEKTKDHPVYLVWVDEGKGLCMNGYFCFEGGRYREALDWYEKAFAHGVKEGWAYWDAARAAAALDLPAVTARYVGKAIEKGFISVDEANP